MKITKNTVVTLTYELYAGGVFADQATQDKPLDYIQGTHTLLEAFEKGVEGLEPGESYQFTLSADEAYGQRDERRLVRVPKSAFEIEGVISDELVKVGHLIPMINANGQVEHGLIREVTEVDVLMDFNHIFAGKSLSFSGKILSVREATEKELKEGLHGEFLPIEEGHHCCGHHGKGCCHGHHEGEEHECCHHEDGGHECCHHEGEPHECCHGEGHEEGGCCGKHESGCCHEN